MKDGQNFNYLYNNLKTRRMAWKFKIVFVACFLHLFVIAKSESQNCELSNKTFSCKNISKFPVNSNGSSVETLDLSYKDNILERLGDSELVIGNFTQLRTLGLRKSGIRWIENGFFQGVDTIQSLDLSYNRISELDLNVFKDLLSLRSLDLHSNSLKNIQDSTFPLLPKLTELRLSGCELSSLGPNLFKSLTNLEVLHLFNNQITFLDNELFSTLINLKELDLSNNKLDLISPSYFADLRNLEYLSLINNPISDIQNGSWNNPNLTRFGLFGCKLRFLQQRMFTGMENLQDFIFGSDMLEAIENNVFVDKKNLTKLSISNYFRKVPTTWDWIKNLVSLTSLNLERNQLTFLKSDIFTNLLNLQKIKLRYDSLYLFDPVVFSDASNLEEIDLSYNPRLEFIKGSSFPTFKLRTLNLGYCNLRSLEPILLKNLAMLTTLHLNGNNFKALDWKVLHPVAKSLVKLRLSDNEWRCDCHFGFLLSMFTQNNNLDWGDSNSLPKCSTVDAVTSPSGTTLVGKNQLSLNDRHQMICSSKIYSLRHKIAKTKSGKSVTLQCDYTGYPPPEVKWLNNGKFLTNGVSYELNLLSKIDNTGEELSKEDEFRYEFSQQFHIKNFTEEDSGSYECQISNIGRNASQSITLEYASLNWEMESTFDNEIFFFIEPGCMGDFYKTNVQNYCQSLPLEQRGMTGSVKTTSCVILFLTENCDDTGGPSIKVKPNQNADLSFFQDVVLSFQSCESYYKSQENQDEPKEENAEDRSSTESTSHVKLKATDTDGNASAICPLCPDCGFKYDHACPRLPEPVCPDCICPACPACILNEIPSTSAKGQSSLPVNKFI